MTGSKRIIQGGASRQLGGLGLVIHFTAAAPESFNEWQVGPACRYGWENCNRARYGNRSFAESRPELGCDRTRRGRRPRRAAPRKDRSHAV